MNAPPALGHPYPWPAPGKLNLFLHIVGRRLDGYHLLQTAFQFIDLCDELSFWQRADGVIERVGEVPGVPAGADLALRAARVLAAQHRVRAGVGIELRKRLPVQGGVGGGSSDAATVLVALNRLWRLDLAVKALSALGLGLGADVPVFVGGQAAWAEGVGDRLTPIDPPESAFVLVRPDCAVSTAKIFQAPELTRNSAPITIRAFFESGGRNDCEPVVRARYPAVAQALDWLGRFSAARLTGTGSCVFASVPDAGRAREIVAQVPERWQGFAVRGRNRSPLLERSAES